MIWVFLPSFRKFEITSKREVLVVVTIQDCEIIEPEEWKEKLRLRAIKADHAAPDRTDEAYAR